MRRRHLLALSALPLLRPVAAAAPSLGPTTVELFTSQGCSSCPAADAALARLVARAGLLPLAFHVTYWDRLGWRDTLGDARFTERQRWYARVLGGRGLYTPQLVVMGEIDLVGSDPRLEPLLAALPEGARPAAIPVDGTGVAELPALDVTPDTRLWAARYEGRRVVAIALGENAGRTIEYRNAVRDLVELGPWDGSPRRLDLGPFGAGGSGLAVVAQDSRSGRVLATGHRVPAPPSAAARGGA
jgi:hypothetical protein